MEKKGLAKELEQRGTAEIINDEVFQITQAIGETEDKAEFLMFGKLKVASVIPIDEACAKCEHRRLSIIKDCQEVQGKDARARGFNKVICPRQFVQIEV